MQTFLPYSDFELSARCLDRQRLGKQRVECAQIIRALVNPSAGWRNHPAVMQWFGFEVALLHYMRAAIDEWIRRGYANSIEVPWHVAGRRPRRDPPWLGDERFHASHRSNLLRKDPAHYSQFNWTEPPDMSYWWPSKEMT